MSTADSKSGDFVRTPRFRLGLAMAIVGTVALVPIASCSGIHWARQSLEAAAEVPLRDPDWLAENARDEDETYRVRVTPEVDRAEAITVERVGAYLVPVRESGRFVLYTRQDGLSELAALGERTATGEAAGNVERELLVHRKRAVVVGMSREGSLFGVPPSKLAFFEPGDTRPHAAREAAFARAMTLAGLVVAVILLPSAWLVLRRRRTAGPR